MTNEVYLTRATAFLPNAPVANDQMEAVLGMAGGIPSRVRRMILRSNGIVSRHYAIDPASRAATHTNAELAAEALRQLFAAPEASEATCLACATSYPDQTMPGHGAMVHGLSPLPPCETVSLAGVCVAGMAAMKYAYQAVKTGEHAAAIATASENASAMMRGEVFQSETDFRLLQHATPEIGFEKDFLRWMLSDGAGAVLLANRPLAGSLNFKIHWIDLLSYANEMPPCMYAGAEIRDGAFHGWKTVSADERAHHSIMAVKQNVKLLNEHIIRYTVEKPLAQIAAKRSLKAEHIDWFLPHYSSEFFRDKVAAGLANAGLPIAQEKWFTNLSSKGNTGSASIYIILEEFMRRQPIGRGQKILCYVPESGRFSTCFMLLEAV
ncbi:3-oxoacyl-[acyl-carrier-protein] synthase 3 [Kingella potus]|uniref:3-oxoacyl-[acyl-carrier-protein] synthase 3 n=1 Tax=Kingella potus TaxID=265175 RepID=A0A377R225_9NEIS|nr:beta-ketoacyl-ACP synthase III [Kingella potus]UOP00662.1 beta-ketoacyl-ACP synthase III [Kingella potus]STR02940.1 3-oxoacyl-[acyl-carrier-protein] synthase 3 [Kingella potus]